MKRYIYPGIGVLAVLGGGLLFMSLDERENLPDTELPAVAVVDGTVSSEPANDDDDNTETDKPTQVAEDTSKEKIPSEDPANNIPAPVNTDPNTAVNPESPIADQIELSPSQEVRTRENGEVYFVDVKTGEEIKTPEDTVHPPTATTELGAPGKGSDADKNSAATSYMNHLNAIVDGDYETACEYILPQPEITNCAERLANRTAEFPLTSAYELSKTETVSIDGNNAYINPLSLRNSEGKGTPAVKLVRSSDSPNGWLLEDKSLISF